MFSALLVRLEGHTPAMMRRSIFVILVLTIGPYPPLTFAQTSEEPVPLPPIIESPTPIPPAPQQDEHLVPEYAKPERDDAVFMLSELRANVRTFPDNAEERLKLAAALYRVGDLDAAIEECRVAVRLNPDDAKAHLQLGVILLAKQDWRAAASVLREAIRLNPELTQAHYSLAGAQYSLGNMKAAIGSYRHAIELQPYFPDARYRLALLLKLTHQEQEAAQLMEEAANGGIAQAQFFLGNAYKNGQGVHKSPAHAIFWWSKAVALGHQPAADALSKLRRQALSPDQQDRRRKDALDAFQLYRDRLWEEFPDYSRGSGSETLGTTLLKEHRTEEAVSVLLQESYALSDVALVELAKLYETGWEPHPAPFDKKILMCLETTAAEGFVPAKKTLARIYAKGLGVAPDLSRAKTLLKGLSKQEMKTVLDELALQ